MTSYSGGSSLIPVLVLAVLLASGCSSPEPQKPIQGETQINQSLNQTPSPVILASPGDKWTCGAIKVDADVLGDRHETLLEAARDADFSFIGLMINHSGNRDAQLSICDHLTRSGLLCIPGLVWGSEGRLIALGTEKDLPANISIEGAISQARRNGAVVIITRPMSTNQSWRRWDISTWDSMAVVSPMSQRRQNDYEAIEKWHNLLNNGQVKHAIGETDIRDFRNTYSLRNMMDSSYQCLRVKGNLSRGSALEALRKGRSIVTNGPVLNLTVNGHPAGSEFNASYGEEVEIFLDVRSASYFDTVRIIRNGIVIQEIGKPLNVFTTNLTSTVVDDTWFSAEVWGADFTPEYHDPVHAISNPVWARVK